MTPFPDAVFDPVELCNRLQVARAGPAPQAQFHYADAQCLEMFVGERVALLSSHFREAQLDVAADDGATRTADRVGNAPNDATNCEHGAMRQQAGKAQKPHADPCGPVSWLPEAGKGFAFAHAVIM
jgi:hypothetical protein